MANPWLQFVKEFRGKNKGMSYSQALKAAAKVYKKGSKAAPAKKSRRAKKKSQK